MIGRLLAVAVLLAAAAPAAADAPLAPAPTTVCSLSGRACASREASGRTASVWVKGPHATRRSTWRAAIASPRLMVADDGRSLVELYRGLNLLEADAGPDTAVLVFHRPGAPPVTVRLYDVAADPGHLPATVTHRQWARAYGFDGKGSFVLLTADGRSLNFDPATGRPRG